MAMWSVSDLASRDPAHPGDTRIHLSIRLATYSAFKGIIINFKHIVVKKTHVIDVMSNRKTFPAHSAAFIKAESGASEILKVRRLENLSKPIKPKNSGHG